MQHETMTPQQAFFAVILFNFGSSVIMGINTKLVQQSWMAILAATLLAVPLFLLYVRILRLFPGKDLFEIARELFGKVTGKVITAFFTWYCIHLAALVVRDFSEFTQITAMPETPQLPIMILLMLTAAYLARSNARAIGKWSVVMAFAVLFVVFLTFGLSIDQATFDDIFPLFEYSPAQVAKASFQVFSFPYAESVIFLGLGGAFAKNPKPYRTFLFALLAILLVFWLVFFRNLTLLGPNMMKKHFFASYAAVRIVDIGGFAARIEGSISSNFLLAGIVKIAACLLAGARGLANLFGLKSHQTMVLPAGMLALALCNLLYQSEMENIAFLEYYAYYAFPFQVVIPLVVFLVGEIRNRRQTRGEQSPGDAAQSPEPSA